VCVCAVRGEGGALHPCLDDVGGGRDGQTPDGALCVCVCVCVCVW
jgi:hypothetical protein